MGVMVFNATFIYIMAVSFLAKETRVPTDLSQITDKPFQTILYRVRHMSGIRTRNFSGDRQLFHR